MDTIQNLDQHVATSKTDIIRSLNQQVATEKYGKSQLLSSTLETEQKKSFNTSAFCLSDTAQPESEVDKEGIVNCILLQFQEKCEMAMKTVAVIGAGVSGITSTKACLEQGMDVTCYEMHNDIGGIWYYTEHSRPDEGATVYDFLMTNTSREMMRFSDFHFPSSAPAFPRHREMHAYLHSYANKFGVTKHVQLETKVIALQKSAGHSSDGTWIVVTQRKGENKKETKEFDAVIVSCGFHRIPNIPEIEGFSNFKGEWSHSKTFKSAKPFTGKRVLVIGNANSALDTATGMADYAEKVYLSVGQGCWVVPRLTNRITYDTFLLRRWHISYLGILDRKWRKVCEDYFNHREAGIRASSGPIHHFPTINDDIGSRIACGKIKVVPRTVQFLTNGVRLEDGTVLQDIDHVVFATGFQPDHNLLVFIIF
ncbi:hypothetical protein KUTeg_007405 [Tegillarca granosa]|uniref:Flavin-containing monooxygenase n=1 Tax=Tegillarca granosa TaxID=220873 RepID=A0ABQ9FHV0_TEGGR|nr:hypothetical protein KUTeg_007405 [Tegillarca granosa]